MDQDEEPQQIPTLPPFTVIAPTDVEQAASIVQRMYHPQTDPATSQNLQKELFELQRRPEAWGLVVPFVTSADPQVQFFGAHTAQVKIARDWDQWPILNAQALRDMLLNLTAQAANSGVSRVVMRKLYTALCSLALRICPLKPSLWTDWVKDILTALLSCPTVEHAPDFLAIAVEEVRSADLLMAAKTKIQASVRLALPLVMQLFITRIPVRDDIPLSGRLAWLKALEAWVDWGLPGDELTSLIPHLIELLRNRDSFVATCDVLEEIMTKSALSSGKGTKVLTEPLLQWIAFEGHLILQESLESGSADETSHGFCKLLMAIGEHSSEWFVAHMENPNVQTYLRVVLGYTGFPGWYGVDEDESEMTLQFWSSFQDAVIDSDFSRDVNNVGWMTIRSVDLELIQTLVRKVRWPTVEEGFKTWGKDSKEKFQNFRRDVGDTLMNTYYIIRDELFTQIVPHVVELLAPGGVPPGGWEHVEAGLYAVKTVQEAIPLSANEWLTVVFGEQILGKLPIQGHDQIRRTALDLVGSYASWFHEQTTSDLLMRAMDYVVKSFSEPALSLHAARALRDLCENNRKTLSGHIDAFATLYANLSSIPDTEKAKVLQAICSVIQALPLKEAIVPVEAVVTPLIGSLADSLGRAAQFPEEARASTVAQLQGLSGCAKGLTNTTDPLLEFSTAEEDREVVRQMEVARQDARMIEMRRKIIDVLTLAMNIWSADAEVGEAVSDLIKAITSLPADNTLLSLPPGPVLQVVCAAASRQTTAVWLSLATMLTTQIDSSTSNTLRLTSDTSSLDEAKHAVASATALLVEYGLRFLSAPQAMEENPDVVRAFFLYATTVANHFPQALLQLPPPLAAGLMECAIKGLTLQERYSLVDAAKFLHAFCRKTLSNPETTPKARELLKQHGPAMSRAVIAGIAGASPRSTIPNLVELLSILLAKVPEHRTWMKDSLYSPQMDNPRITREAKDKFIYVATSSRSNRQTAEAANEFSLIARGLEGSSFGYASATV